jgi:hypothetical protein
MSNIETVKRALEEYDSAAKWHSYRPGDINRETAESVAAAKLANAVRAMLAAPKPAPRYDSDVFSEAQAE